MALIITKDYNYFMNIKLFIVLFLVLQFLWKRWLVYLTWKQRKKPLPDIVSNIYTKERYESYLSYKKEYRNIDLGISIISLILDCVFILSNFYTLFDNQNPYISAALTVLVSHVISQIITIPLSYYATFSIEERYGKNKKTKKEWLKDYLLNLFLEIVLNIVVFGFIIFVCTSLSKWTNNFDISYLKSFVICAIIVAIFFVIMVLLSLLSLVIMRIQYKFVEMEDNDLKKKIEEYAKETKKKVRHIKVYNESKKSNSKNAFLLKLLWYREFGIADNFLNENDQDELLAVLLHEIGHLKHKKNFYNYLVYFIYAMLFVFIVWLLPNGEYVIKINSYINNSFGLEYTNYILSLTILSYAITPLSFIFSIYNNYVSCMEEKEADFNAVDHGYGQSLINTFNQLSSDELIDVNPHPIVELLEYDHPGMYKRISYIKERIEHNS